MIISISTDRVWPLLLIGIDGQLQQQQRQGVAVVTDLTGSAGRPTSNFFQQQSQGGFGSLAHSGMGSSPRAYLHSQTPPAGQQIHQIQQTQQAQSQGSELQQPQGISGQLAMRAPVPLVKATDSFKVRLGLLCFDRRNSDRLSRCFLL